VSQQLQLGRWARREFWIACARSLETSGDGTDVEFAAWAGRAEAFAQAFELYGATARALASGDESAYAKAWQQGYEDTLAQIAQRRADAPVPPVRRTPSHSPA
jgi:hypothetical protein